MKFTNEEIELLYKSMDYYARCVSEFGTDEDLKNITEMAINIFQKLGIANIKI